MISVLHIKSKKDKEKEISYIKFLHSQSFLEYFIIFGGIFFILGWLILIVNENQIREINADLVKSVDTSAYRFNLDTVICEKDNLPDTKDFVQITGWVIKPGEEVRNAAIKIVIKNMNTGKYYVLPTDLIVRNDVTVFFNDGNDYDYCGFAVKIPYWDDLDTNTDYEIFAQYDLNENKRVFISFNTSLKEKSGVIR